MEENQQATARENIMGTMNINPLLVKLSVPMMVSMLVQALYNVVDSIFVSHVSESARHDRSGRGHGRGRQRPALQKPG